MVWEWKILCVCCVWVCVCSVSEWYDGHFLGWFIVFVSSACVNTLPPAIYYMRSAWTRLCEWVLVCNGCVLCKYVYVQVCVCALLYVFIFNIKIEHSCKCGCIKSVDSSGKRVWRPLQWHPFPVQFFFLFFFFFNAIFSSWRVVQMSHFISCVDECHVYSYSVIFSTVPFLKILIFVCFCSSFCSKIQSPES